MSIILTDQLSQIRSSYPPGKRIAFCSGSFDLLHAGHALFLDACKKSSDCLVVSVGNDIAINAMKGDGRPVVREHTRLALVDLLKSVDYCYLDTISRSASDLALVLEIAFDNLRPNSYVINDDAFDIETRYKLCKEHMVKMVVFSKTDYAGDFCDVSTSSIIERIRAT